MQTMRLLNSLPFVIFPIFFILEPCETFSQNEIWITDLESSDSTGFTNEANSWVYKGAACPSCIFTTPPGTTCDSNQEGQMVFGGPRAAPGSSSDYFERTYTSSSTAWNLLALGFEIWVFTTSELTNAASASWSQISSAKIGSFVWSGVSPVLIGSCSTDFTSFQGSQIKYIYKYSIKSTIGLGTPGNPMSFGVKKGLSAPAYVDSVGMRNVRIYNGAFIPNFGSVNLPCAAGYRWTGTICEDCYITCRSCSGPNQGECTDCFSTSYSYGNGICLSTPCSGAYQLVTGTKNCIQSCSTGFYWERDVNCRESCDQPLVQSVDANGGAPTCSSPCSDAAQFVYPDGSCSSTCDPLLKDESEATLKLCLSPCQTNSEFVYPDGTCVNTCPTPLSGKTEKDIRYCESPCPSTAKFLYKDQSCSSTCDPPLIDSTENGIFSCGSPCEGSTKYLYPNGACVNTCPTPLSEKTENNIKFCYNTCYGVAKYVNPDKSCSATCDPLLIENTENGIFSCSSPCSDSTKYLYPDGACLNTCPTPLSEKTEKDVKYCENPCSGATKYVNPDGSCTSACDSLLKANAENGIFSCSSPCQTSSEFVYPDGSCVNTCPALLSEKTEKDVKYCESPCSDATQYVYSDKSCSSQCAYPLSSKIESGVKYCFSPCDDYLYKDGSCLQNCNPPYIKSQSYNVNQCLSPCQDPSKGYFYEADQACKSTCTPPYESKIVDGVKFCSKTSQMTAQEVEDTEKLVSSIKSQGQVTETGMKTLSRGNSGGQSFAWLAGQATMLFYIRYINLNYTSKLKLVLFLQDASPFDFTVGIDMPKGLQEKLRDRELPEVFERYEVHSNYFYNSWDMLSTFLLTLGIILALSVMKLWQGIFDASMQLQTDFGDSFWEVLSIILAIFMIVVGIAILALNGKVVRDLWKSQNVESSREEMEKKWANFELFFESCERDSLVSFGCMAIFLGRTIVFNLIIANLYNYPLLQSILINLTTFGMAGYLIKKRPLKNLLEFSQILLSEVFVVIVNMCALIIAIMDQAQIEGQSLRNDLCNTIIIIFFIFASVNLAFLVIQIFVALFFLMRTLRCLKAQGQLNLRGVSNALLFGDIVEEKSNGRNLPAQIHPQMREISQNQSEPLHVTEDFSNSNRIQTIHETNEIFIPHRPSGRRITNASRKIRPSFSFLDRSAGEMLPSDGSFHNTMGSRDLSPDLNQQVTLESSNRDSVVHTVDSEKRDLDSQDTISQYRKMKSYLRRSRDRKQPE